MNAIINGVTVTGTPEEIAKLMKLTGNQTKVVVDDVPEHVKKYREIHGSWTNKGAEAKDIKVWL